MVGRFKDLLSLATLNELAHTIHNPKDSDMVRGNGFGFWNSMPTLRRNISRSVDEAKTSVSPTCIDPLTLQPRIRSVSRFIEERNVVFPQPEGPIKAVT